MLASGDPANDEKTGPTGMKHDGASRTQHRKLLQWVDEIAALCQPDRIYWCDGSREEYDRLCDQMVDSGTFLRLNQDKRP
ncbi:MAG: hypothetical protein PVF93_03150, partial [Chromatiaceae bacterium]